MEHLAALRAAIDVLQVPSRLPKMRNRSLPAGVVLLLEIAAGNEAALEIAARGAECSKGLAKSAAIFFIEQVLLFADSDSYRVLGAQNDAPREHLRRNMALLMRWLHPDSANADRAALALRVTSAWEKLKTDDQRAYYDDILARSSRRVSDTSSKEKLSASKRAQLQRERLLKAGVKAKFLTPEGMRPAGRRQGGNILRELQSLFDKLRK